MWTDANGNEIEIASMGDNYLLNAHRYACRTLNDLHEQLRMVTSSWSMVSGEHAEWELERHMEHIGEMCGELQYAIGEMEEQITNRKLTALSI